MSTCRECGRPMRRAVAAGFQARCNRCGVGNFVGWVVMAVIACVVILAASWVWNTLTAPAQCQSSSCQENRDAP